MKVNKSSNPKASASKVDSKTSAKNLFLNLSIAILLVIIFYLLYSIIIKVLMPAENETAEGKSNVAAAVVQLEVLNGCGVPGIGEKFTTFLRAKSFDVVNLGNYISSDVINTLVIDRRGNLENAKKVAEALGVKKENVIQQINNDYFLDVTLVLGKDFNQLKPYR
ncbi:MAG: LytR family transcriptional regulator [Ignavibacteriales bacterium]|nr:MAG: LytR family transcriptional regulator [Ignavibacteriales bacterium]